MKKNEKTKMVLCDVRKDKLVKRKYCREHNISNISLNLISVSVLPPNTSWSDMEGFVSKKFGPFKFSCRNAKDDVVAGIEFFFTFLCKGKYNSTGQYLAEVTISPNEIFANIGYEFICNVTASEPINSGTKANPIADVVLKVQMQVRSHHRLKVSLLNSIGNSIETKVLQNSNEQVEIMNIATIPKSLNTKTLKEIFPSSRSRHTVNTVSSKISHFCRNSYYVEEQFANVLICGDGQVSILSAYGY